jgi:hypothetical protein
MRLIILTIFLTSILFCQGQQVKTFSGDYNTAKGIGKADYKYFEDSNLLRVYNGPFSFKTKDVDHMCCSNITGVISGQYSNNKKDKLWNASYHFIYGAIIDEKINVTGNYKQGKLNGTWTIKYSIKKNNSVKSETYSINFKENVIVGKYNAPVYHLLTNGGSKLEEFISINCSFDSSGYLDGLCQIKDNKKRIEFVSTYRNGILVKYLKRDFSNGEIFEKTDTTKFANEFLINMDKSNQKAMLGDKQFKLEEKRNFTEAEMIIIEAISFWTISPNSNKYRYGESYEGNPINLDTKGVEELKQIIAKEIKEIKN